MPKKSDIYLTRIIQYFKKLDRIGMIWYGSLLCACILLSAVFGFTVINHEYYKKTADRLQKAIIKNPVSRGTISSSAHSLAGVMAVSTNLGTLAIDPTQTGSVAGLLDFLGDAVFNEYCAHKSGQDCVSALSVYTRDPELLEVTSITEAELKSKIRIYIQSRMDTPIESVIIAPGLSDDTIHQIGLLEEPALFFVVNNLYVNPTQVQNAEQLAQKLASLLGIKAEDLVPKFAIRKKQYLEVIRKMNISTRDLVNAFLKNNTETVTKLIQDSQYKGQPSSEREEKRREIIEKHAVYPFINIQDNLVRYYPEGTSLGQITGFVDGEGVGRYGIEGYFEHELQRESPTQVITKDIRGRIIRDYASWGYLTTQKNWANITLTIDRNIQKELSKILENATKRFRADRGSIIVMDPKTGAITAMVNYPSYDPNNFTDVYDMEPVLYADYPNPREDLFGMPIYVVDTQSGTLSTNIAGKRLKLREATDDEINNFAIQKYKFKNKYGVGNYQNHVISALYEPGSVFKAITVAIGLDTGEIRPNDTYYDKNYVELDSWGVKQRINNLAKWRCGGYHTYANALNWSCNVGMIHIIEKIWRTLFETYIHDFWLGEKTNLTIDGEVFGQIAPSDKWSRMQFFTMSFGQGINMTMLQMAAAYSVLANGGVYMQPYIVESIEYPDGRVIPTVPIPLRRVIKEETSKTITAMLVDGAQNGFAAKGSVPGYAIAGKTGTSQIPYRGTYENIYFKKEVGHTTTSYGGYAPAYNPKFVMIVRFERPRTSAHAEQTAAAVFAEAAAYLLNYYKIPKNQ